MGGKILAGADTAFLKIARNIALTHHEKWDGTGYPRRIRGVDIPIEGRITAIADVFDALVSRRPFRDAVPIEEALMTIKLSRGIHFDPDVVEAFFGVLDIFLQRMKEEL